MTLLGQTLVRSTWGKNALFGVAVVALALAVGFSLGNPGVAGLPILVIAAAGLAAVAWLGRAYLGFLLMVASSFFLFVLAATEDRYINAFDLILPFMLPAAFFGLLRKEAQEQDRLEVGGGHDLIRSATTRVTRPVVLFYALSVISLVPMLFRVGGTPTMGSAFLLVRAVEGLLIFPLGLWWLRSEKRFGAIFVAAGLAATLHMIVSVYQRVVLEAPRPGMTWVVNQPSWPTEDPNQAGVAMVGVIALLFARHAVRATPWTYVVAINAVVVIMLTQSRSSLVALGTFLALTLKWARPRYVVLGVVILALALVLAPEDVRTRLFRTVTVEKGSHDVYSFMLRVYGYWACLGVFRDNWLLGTGYLGGNNFTHNYNPLGILGLSAENFFLETAMGLGVFGLALLVFCFVRLFQLGSAVRKVTAPGTLAHEMGRLHAPLLAGIIGANMTGNNLTGVAALAEIAIWCALLVRAGHVAVQAAEVPAR